jgi:hypothetical protein
LELPPAEEGHGTGHNSDHVLYDQHDIGNTHNDRSAAAHDGNDRHNRSAAAHDGNDRYNRRLTFGN